MQRLGQALRPDRAGAAGPNPLAASPPAPNQPARWLQWTCALTLLFTVLLTYRTTTGVFVVLIPGLVLAMAVWIDRWGSRAAGWVVLHLLALGGGLWWLSFRTSAGDQESLVMFLPAPFLILIELWWVRRGAGRTMRFPA